jgi:hypothetical protein
MSKPAILANAVAAVWGTAYALCGIAAMIFPNLYFGVLNNWFHSINLELIKSTTPLTPTLFLMGLATFSIYIWVITFATASVYNAWSKKR